MSVVVVVNIESKPGRSDEALEIIRASQTLCLSTNGCTGFEILQNRDEVHKFSFIERWDSIEIHKTFLEQLMNNQDFIKSMEIFTSGPVIEYYQPL